MRAAEKPIKEGRVRVTSKFEVSVRFNTKAPSMAGMLNIKEKVKAVFFERPEKIPAEIVEPERETPGRMAIA